MKAIRFYEFGDAGVLTLDDAPDPAPADGEVLVRIAAAGVNPTDVSRRSGRMGTGGELPAQLGVEGAGVVEAVGAGVASVAVGERVIVRQPPRACTYAELAAVPESAVFAAPDNLSLVDASTVAIITTTAWAALCVQGRAQAGDAVLVQAAASGVGVAAVQLAKLLGMTVIGTASSDEKLAWAAQYGLDHAVNYAEQDFVEEVRRITDGRGVDVIVDGVGGDVLSRGIGALARGGRLAVFGAAGGRDVTFPVAGLYRTGASVIGAGAAMTTPSDFRQILAWFAEGKLRPTIDRTFPLEQAAEAHRYQESRRIKGKTALVVSGE